MTTVPSYGSRRKGQRGAYDIATPEGQREARDIATANGCESSSLTAIEERVARGL
jgi:hypothetical protein